MKNDIGNLGYVLVLIDDFYLGESCIGPGVKKIRNIF